jgi:two-component system response regulator FlrC
LLDEISEMRLDLQAKLLRVLQEQEFERVGGTSPIKVDVRIVATTNRNLAAEAAAGTFRQDLYYRLSVIPILIPPLRERPEDVPLLAYRFAMRTSSEMGKEIKGISPDAMVLLQRSPWAGNVRELQHAVERAVILSDQPVLQPYHFDASRFGLAVDTDPGIAAAQRRSGSQPAPFVPENSPRPPVQLPSHAAPSYETPSSPVPAVTAPAPMVATETPVPAPITIAEPLRSGTSVTIETLNVAEAEQALILRALEVTGGNRTKAAELLGISVRTLRNKLNNPGKDTDEDEE